MISINPINNRSTVRSDIVLLTARPAFHQQFLRQLLQKLTVNVFNDNTTANSAYYTYYRCGKTDHKY